MPAKTEARKYNLKSVSFTMQRIYIRAPGSVPGKLIFQPMGWYCPDYRKCVIYDE
ncbi:MAG: hypothetical protein WCJ93_00705 [Methanomicrobiales archaeon]